MSKTESLSDNNELWGEPAEVKFVYGGNVQAGDGFYVGRNVDSQLLQLCKEGKYAYILAPRQLGKSSLMYRTAEALYRTGIQSAIIDLSLMGDPSTKEQPWYSQLFQLMKDQLRLKVDVDEWQKSHSSQGATSSLELFLREVVLKQIDSPVVIFLDEIDSTINLSFKDDFFAAIRYFYQARALNPEFRRLSFVMIGVARPSDLIRDPNRTPFNIGEHVDLKDFSFDEAVPLSDGLELAPDHAKQVLGWILDWTAGHPYLTMRLCSEIAEQDRPSWTKAEVDALVADTFFGEKSERDNNLLFVRDMLISRMPPGVEPAEILTTYRDIRRSRTGIKDDERSSIKSHLKLAGIVRREAGMLRVRNPIYHRVFDEKWIKEHLPPSWAKQQYQRVRRIAAVLIVLLAAFLVATVFAVTKTVEARNQKLIAEQQTKIAEQEKARAEDNARLAQQRAWELDRQREQAVTLAERQKSLRKEADELRDLAEQQRHQAENLAAREKTARAEAEESKKIADESLKKTQVALDKAEEAKRLADDLRNKAQARANTEKLYRNSAQFYFSEDYDNAVKGFTQVIKEYRDMSDSQAEAFTLNNLGDAYENLNNRQKAIEAYNGALEIYKRLKDLSGQAYTVLNLGSLYADSDEKKAVDYYNEALSLYKENKDTKGQADALLALGRASYDPDDWEQEKEDFEAALKFYTDAMSLYTKDSDFSGLGEALRLITRTRLKTISDPKQLLESYSDLLEFYKRTQNKSATADTLKELAELYSEQKDTPNAILKLREALLIYREIGDQSNERQTLDKLVSMPISPEERGRLIADFQRLAESYKSKENYSAQVETLESVGNLCLTSGHEQEAKQLFEQALQISQERQLGALVPAMQRRIAKTYNDFGEKTKAIEYYIQARDSYLKMPVPADTSERSSSEETPVVEAARMLAAIAEIYYGLGEKRKALDYLKQLLETRHRAEGISLQRRIDGEYLIESINFISQELGDNGTPAFYEKLLASSGTKARKLNLLFELGRVDGSDLKTRAKYLDEAVVLLDQKSEAWRKSRSNSGIWLSFVYYYNELHQKEKAIEMLDRANSARRQESITGRSDFENRSLALWYQRLGKRKKASELFQQMEGISNITFYAIEESEPAP